MKIRLVTVVWGREYAELFLRGSLRTLLAEGNCPALARAHQVIYTIYTTADGAELLEAAPVFIRLREQMEVRVSVFAPGEIDDTNHGSHGYFWNREIDLARQNSAVLFFIIPDVLYAKDTLTRWAARFDAGAGAIFTIGPQVVLETIIPEIEERFQDSGAVFSIEQDELYDLLFRHLHPLHVAMRHDSDRRPPHPEYDLRLVPEHGIVIREIVSHPFCINPRIYNELRHYGPRDHLDTIVCEPCMTLSVEPLLKRVNSYYRPWPLDEARLTNLALWWDHYTTEACEYESNFPFDIYPSNDAKWPTVRRRAVAGGRFYRSQIVSSGRLYQLFSELKKRQSYKAASLLALAIYAARLRRRLPLRDGATILVPSERALAADEKRIAPLLVPGREQELIDLFADHIICSKENVARSHRLQHLIRRREKPAVGDGAIFTARGMAGEPLLRDVTRKGTPFSVGPFNVIMIDRILWRDQLPEAESADVAPSGPAESDHAVAPTAKSSTFVVTAWGQRSNLRRMLFYAAHIPLLEPLIAMLFHRIYYPHAMRVIQYEGRMFRIARRVPRAIWHRSRGIPIVGPVLRRALYAAMLLLGLLRKVKTAVRVMRREGFRQALNLTLVRLNLGAFSSMKAGHAVSEAERNFIDEIRNVRVMETVAAVLTDFQSKMGSEKFKSAPLELLERILREQKLDVAKAPLLEKALRGLTVSNPQWSEPWLELGFLHEDQGRLDEALVCFSKAMAGLRPNDLPDRDPHPAAVAGARRGKLLADAGNDAEAQACFKLCLGYDPGQRMVAVQYANLLRRLGHYDQALVYYSEGMYYQESRWSLPVPPRDAGRLRFPHLTGRMREIREPDFSPESSKK